MSDLSRSYYKKVFPLLGNFESSILFTLLTMEKLVFLFNMSLDLLVEPIEHSGYISSCLYQTSKIIKTWFLQILINGYFLIFFLVETKTNILNSFLSIHSKMQHMDLIWEKQICSCNKFICCERYFYSIFIIYYLLCGLSYI